MAEAKNLNDFYEFHKSVHGVTCPKSYLDLCTEHVVVMDYVDGISIADPERLVAEGYDLEKIGAAIVEDYSTQVLDDGFSMPTRMRETLFSRTASFTLSTWAWSDACRVTIAVSSRT